MPGRMAHMLVRSVKILVDRRMTPEEIGHVVGEKARASVDDLIQRDLIPSTYTVFVDGREGESEDAVNLIDGRIEYVFERIAAAAAFAYEFCRQMSPYGGSKDRHAGAFFHAWLIVADGRPVVLTDIPSDADEIIIVNPAPYSRRLEQTIGKTRPAYHITEAARAATQRRFPTMDVRRRFVDLPGPSTGTWEVPYERRRDPREPILYPAVVITSRQ